MSELPEDIHYELQAALDDQLALWDGDQRALHAVNERLLDILKRARAFELASSDGLPIEAGEAVTPTSALWAALAEQQAAQQSGDSARQARANQDLAEAYRQFNNGQPPESQ